MVWAAVFALMVTLPPCPSQKTSCMSQRGHLIVEGQVKQEAEPRRAISFWKDVRELRGKPH